MDLYQLSVAVSYCLSSEELFKGIVNMCAPESYRIYNSNQNEKHIVIIV